MKKTTFLFLLSLCLAQNGYIGSLSFDYSGSESGSFHAELNDSTLGGATATIIIDDTSSTLFIAAIQAIDSIYFSALFIYMVADYSIFMSGDWPLPPGDILNPNIIFGFFPEIDTSFFSQFSDLIPDSIGLDSTFIEDLIDDLITIMINESYLGITGAVNLNHIDDDSISGSFDVGALQLGFPPGVISISSGSIELSGVVLPQVEIKDDPILPDQFTMYPAFPNPFNPTTTIRFTIGARQASLLRVYNIKGQLVKTLVNEQLPIGEHEIKWNASTQPSGVYFVQLVSGNYSQTEKVLLIK